MVRVVVDTNILVSFLLTGGETISRLVDWWEEEKIQLLVNDEIGVEYKQMAEKLVSRRLVDSGRAAALMRNLETEAVRVPSISVVAKSADPKDNRYLACALDGGADYLVTGDKKHLLPLKQIGRTKIVSPAEFVELIS